MRPNKFTKGVQRKIVNLALPEPLLKKIQTFMLNNRIQVDISDFIRLAIWAVLCNGLPDDLPAIPGMIDASEVGDA